MIFLVNTNNTNFFDPSEGTFILSYAIYVPYSLQSAFVNSDSDKST